MLFYAILCYAGVLRGYVLSLLFSALVVEVDSLTSMEIPFLLDGRVTPLRRYTASVYIDV